MSIDDYVGVCVGTGIVVVSIAFMLIVIKMWRD
jgi:hypothetical protein